MLFVSCKKNEIQNNSSSIIGEWIWLSTCGGVTLNGNTLYLTYEGTDFGSAYKRVK